MEVAAHVLSRLSRQGADVEIELDHVGDDVGLDAAVHDVGRERRVGAGVGE